MSEANWLKRQRAVSKSPYGNAWVIVDFKTDEEIGAQLHRYQRQVALYAEAVFKSVQKPTSAYILQI